MAKSYNNKFENNIDVVGGANAYHTPGQGTQVSVTGNLPDKGENYFEARIYIKDHGKTATNESLITRREPEWVDFTEIENIYRIKDINDIISIGAEGETPFVFQASTVNINLDNSDYIFDNLKKANLVTVNGNEAKFISTIENTNYDLTYREVKITGKFAKTNRIIEQDLAHFYLRNIKTNTAGIATLTLDSLEKPFMETSAEKVRDGRNWYRERSIKFLTQELIKSARSQYNDGKEILNSEDKISISNIETPDSSRVFSEIGKPIAVIKSTDNTIAGEKKFIVTAAVARNIFKSKLMQNSGAGSNIINIGIEVGNNFTIKKGDVLTIGIAGSNEEKVEVIKDITFNGDPKYVSTYYFSGTPPKDLEVRNIEVSLLKQDHVKDEIVERWIIYLGVTRTIEEKAEEKEEVYVLAYDPDRDEYVSLIYKDYDNGISNSGNNNKEYLRYPIRFLGLKHKLNSNGDLYNEYGLPVVTKLVAVGCHHTYPGQPNENGNFVIWNVDVTANWDDNSKHLTNAVETLSPSVDGGVYTGEMCFRTLDTVINDTYMNIDGADLYKTAIYGALGIGQFVPESNFHANSGLDSYKYAGKTYMGYGYYTTLVNNVVASLDAKVMSIEVNTITYEDMIMGFHGHTDADGNADIKGNIFIIGCNRSNKDKIDTQLIGTYPYHADVEGQIAIEENFNENIQLNTAIIKYGYKSGENKITYELDGDGLTNNFDKNNAVVIIIPDTGKMYLKNNGENLMVIEPQIIKFNSWNRDTGESEILDDDIYHDKIHMENRTDIDAKSKITDKAFDKELNDNISVEKGYYGALVQRKKLRVSAGDVITSGSVITSELDGHGINIRAVLAEYIAMPFNTRDYDFGAPIIDGDGQYVITGTHDDLPIAGVHDNITYNRDVHCWIYPVVGLWVKYDDQNESLFAFDGSKISEHGNSELLGYWYLTDETGLISNAEDRDNRITSNTPLIDLAISDEKGLVLTPQAGTNFDDLLAKEHLPLCTIIHNVWDTKYYQGVAGTKLRFQGSITATMKNAIKAMVGGNWKLDWYEFKGNRLEYYRWDPEGDDFDGTYPLGCKWVFKAIKNPQGNGSVFVSPFCQPVRPYHDHYPYGSDSESKFHDSQGVYQNPTNVNGFLAYGYNFSGATIETTDYWFSVGAISGTEFNKIIIGNVVDITLNGLYLGSYEVLDKSTTRFKVKDFLVRNLSYGEYGEHYDGYPVGGFRTTFNDTTSSYSISDKTDPYDGYFVNSNFESGSEEKFNYYNNAEENLNSQLLWVADRFTQGKICGLVHGKAASNNAGRGATGFFCGAKITDSNSVIKELQIPLGYFFGHTNLITLNLGTNDLIERFAKLTDGVLVRNEIFAENNTEIRYEGTSVFNIGDIVDIIVSRLGVTVYLLKWKVLGIGSGSGYSSIILENSDAIWEDIYNNSKLLPSIFHGYFKIKKCTAILPGDIYNGYNGLHISNNGILQVINIIDDNTLVCKWIPFKDNYDISATTIISRISSYNPNAEQTRSVISITGATNINTDGIIETPMYLPEYIKHLDVLPTVPTDSASGPTYELGRKRQILSIFRICFNTAPMQFGNLNYPKALYSINLHKFWYYFERMTKQTNGDNKFDSGIKPCEFGSYFFDQCAKYYLSRYDDTGGLVIRTDCYTPNFNMPALGSDDNLYAIIHANSIAEENTNRYVFMKFCMNFQKNFKLDPYNDNILCFSRRKFKINPLKKLYIDGRISLFDFTTNSPLITDMAIFPNCLFERDTIDEIITGTELDTIDEGTGLDNFENEIDENPKINEIETYSLGDFEPHGLWKSYEGQLFNAGILTWKNDGNIEFVNNKTLEPFIRPYYAGLSTFKLGYGIGAGWELVEWLDAEEINGNVQSRLMYFHNYLDDYLNRGEIFLIKGWVEDAEEHIFIGGWDSLKTLRGIILRKKGMLSADETEKEQREFLGIFAIQKKNSVELYLERVWATSTFKFYSEETIPFIRKFTFKTAANDGYYFLDSKDNTMKKWNGITFLGTPILTQIGNSMPCVEGDFGQYELMLKIDTAYDEIFGFSSGKKLHQAVSAIKGGRNIIWKLSKDITYHLVAADFSGLNVWAVLSQFAELTNSILSFDRYGRLHFENRPSINSNSPHIYTFDKINIGNIYSIEKESAFENIYNYIEVVPSKPVLPPPTIDFTATSEISSLELNNDLFIKDNSLTVIETDNNKGRPNIQVYQKDLERKRISLICNDGQFNNGNPDEEKGMGSRWKYLVVNNNIELRLAEEAAIGQTYIIVNKIPFDNSSNEIMIRSGNIVYIGNNGPYYIKEKSSVQNNNYKGKADISYIDNRINLTTALTTNFDNGMPVIIIEDESQTGIFHAAGKGDAQTKLTYSPHDWYAEIGEWAFDESKKRPYRRLVSNLHDDSDTLQLDNTQYMSVRGGIISINGNLIHYSRIEGKVLYIDRGIEMPSGSKVYLMPDRPVMEDLLNANYNTEAWRIGGKDEIGPSALSELALYDPNGDGTPYYDDDPENGGIPITALEFYWEKQKIISYIDPTGSGDLIQNYDLISKIDYRTRHRTFVNLKIDFASHRFSEGDRIDIDFQGLKLEAQEQLKKIYSDYDSIIRNGLRQYPSTDNRFFNNKTALIFAKRILAGISNIGCKLVIEADINDVNIIDYLKIIKIVDQDLFYGKSGNSVKAYIKNIQFNKRTQKAILTCYTEAI